MRCPPTEILSDLARGESTQRDEALVLHLRECAHCQATLLLLGSSDAARTKRGATTIGGSDRQDIDATTAFESDRTADPAHNGPDTVDYHVDQSDPNTNTAAVQGTIGRYELIRRLGQGAFGTVFLARDTELDRLVAIKLAHKNRIRNAEDIRRYLEEAKALAALDHPHVLPVHDVGRLEDGSFYVVTKYVEGTDLSGLIQSAPPFQGESARLIARVADGLDHAHRQGLIHRDIKPANILIALDGHPYLADFGLALRESDVTQRSVVAGTPDYMSPEQARGEGHRIDGRTDIYSLGVVFYRLLAGRRPYEASEIIQLLDKVAHERIVAPIELNPGLAPELNRICLKMLEKRASDRYQVAADLVADLEDWLTRGGNPLVESASLPPAPKGLRGYGSSDAGSFLALLPGPRDRDGLPDSVAFWKRGIESTEIGAFPVGLLIGPSGSGKSSLVAAGVLPRLARHIEPIVVDLARGQGEARILAAVRSALPNIAPELGLRDTLAEIRRGRTRIGRGKVLIVLDQFEQHLATSAENDELVEALRQCDGVGLQALLIVRDDFALSVSRFFERIEVPLVQGQNFAVVDRFTREHARTVLLAFGRSLGRIPPTPARPTVEVEAFLNRSLDELLLSGDISPVRLAVFAEMVKDRPWTAGSFRQHGGLEGLGVAFLDGLFTSSAAHPRLRALAAPARMMLRELMPPVGTNIRGGSKTGSELKAAIGSEIDNATLRELATLLDSEARLITMVGDDPQTNSSEPIVRYQLTHDYLVPSLRAWLTLKQRETRRGRAELLLAERAAGWALDPSIRQLPSLWAMPSILWLTQRRLWTEPERTMMQRATRYHGRQVTIVFNVLLFVSIFAYMGWRGIVEGSGEQFATNMVQRLIDSEPIPAQGVLTEIYASQTDMIPALDRALRQEAEGGRRHRRVAMGLLKSRPELTDLLIREVQDPDLDLAERLLIGFALEPEAARARPPLWSTLTDDEANPDRRLAAALVLAKLDASNAAWGNEAEPVASALLARIVANPAEFPMLLKALEPVRSVLVAPLLQLFRGSNPESRPIAFNILTRFAAADPKALVALLEEAEPKRIGELIPLLRRLGPAAKDLLESRLAEKPEPRRIDPPPGLPDAPASASEILTKAAGRVDARFAFCQTLPPGELPPLAESLRAAGYRPIRVRPYADGEATSIAAVWARDAREWRLAVGATLDEFPLRQNAAGKEGFQPVDVATFLTPGVADAKVPRVAAVWVRGEPGEPERRITVGLSDEAFEKARHALDDEEFAPLTHHVLDLDREGHRLHSAIWVKSDRTQLLTSREFDGSVGDYGGDLFLGAVEIDVSLGITDRPRNLARLLEERLAAVEARLDKERAEKIEARLKGATDDPNLRSERADLHFHLGQDEKALEEWDALMKEFSTYNWMWKMPRVLLYARRGDLHRARADLRDYLAKSKDEGKNAYLKAYLAACEGDVAGAVDRLIAEARQHGGDPSFLYFASNGMSWIAGLATRRNLPEAKRYVEQTIDLLEASVAAGRKITPDLRDDPDFKPVNQHPRFLALVGRGRLEDRYTAIWELLPGIESTEIHGLPPDEHAARCLDLASKGYVPAAIGAFRPALDRPAFAASVWHRPIVSAADRLSLVNRQANAALALFQLGREDSTWPLLRHNPDPSLATAILHRFADAGVKPGALATRLGVETDPDARRMLILALGSMLPPKQDGTLRESLVERFSRTFREDGDPGVRSAAESALRRWGRTDAVKIDPNAEANGPRAGFGWYVDHSGNTMVVAGPATFEMGRRPEELDRSSTRAEDLHRREIPRRFALASKEVTNVQFATFLAENPEFKETYHSRRDLSPDADGPAIQVTWPLAQAYCRWRTRKEEIGDDQQCYDEVDPKAEGSIRLREGYLARTGYRLPTEGEWEFMARAGTTTRTTFGWSDDVLPQYAWFIANSPTPGAPRGQAHPAGLLMPNRRGIFDILGNAAEWTSDYRRLPVSPKPGKPMLDSEWPGEVHEADYVTARGGSFIQSVRELSAASRYAVHPSFNGGEVGFRVARTLPD